MSDTSRQNLLKRFTPRFRHAFLALSCACLIDRNCTGVAKFPVLRDERQVEAGIPTGTSSQSSGRKLSAQRQLLVVRIGFPGGKHGNTINNSSPSLLSLEPVVHTAQCHQAEKSHHSVQGQYSRRPFISPWFELCFCRHRRPAIIDLLAWLRAVPATKKMEKRLLILGPLNFQRKFSSPLATSLIPPTSPTCVIFSAARSLVGSVVPPGGSLLLPCDRVL